MEIRARAFTIVEAQRPERGRPLLRGAARTATRLTVGVAFLAGLTAHAADTPKAGATGVQVKLTSLRPGPLVVFGLPLPAGQVKRAEDVRVTSQGKALPARVDELLGEHDGRGAHVGVRAVLVQLRTEQPLGAVEVSWAPDGARDVGAPARAPAFDDPSRSWSSPENIATRTRSLAPTKGGAVLTEGPVETRTLWIGREPNTLATFPDGYLAHQGLLGHQVSAREARAGTQKGMRFLSEAAAGFAGAAMYDLPYAVSSAPEAAPDPKANFEAWLYDRCATFLLVHAHTQQERFLRHAYRTCSWYAREIRLDGPDRGTFGGKPEADSKYSHARGLYAYYALTGDEAAATAVRAIADLWLDDKVVVTKYRQGSLRAPDHLFTERLLGTAMEGLYYGHRLTGETKYLVAFRELFETAYRHVAGSAADLAKINPWCHFPPQNCFVHSAGQHGEAGDDKPWCSGWMVELMLDPLLRYQEQTGDARVDEIFVRLTRFLRDTGTSYFRNNPFDDSFTKPGVCDTDPSDPDRRMLTPLYGAGIDAQGKRVRSPEWDDFQHCVDASSLVAAGLRGLRRQGLFDKNPVAPFATEGASFLKLHEELASCAERTFAHDHRAGRAPSSWKPEGLAPGLAQPAKFLQDNKIGYPTYNNSPLRKLSWWLNSSLETWGLLEDAKVTVRALSPGFFKGPGCK